jgi:hypothetical protein
MKALVPSFFFAAGSVCLLVGTVMTIVRDWPR